MPPRTTRSCSRSSKPWTAPGKVTAAWNRLPEDLKSANTTKHPPQAPPIFTRETIIKRFDDLFHRCAPSFHTFDEEGVQQMKALFAYFLDYITTEAQQGVAANRSPLGWSTPTPRRICKRSRRS